MYYISLILILVVIVFRPKEKKVYKEGFYKVQVDGYRVEFDITLKDGTHRVVVQEPDPENSFDISINKNHFGNDYVITNRNEQIYVPSIVSKKHFYRQLLKTTAYKWKKTY